MKKVDAQKSPLPSQQHVELSAQINTAKERERTRIAREIHDDLGGNLSAIKMALAVLKSRLPANPLLHEKADYLDALVDRTIEATHRISVDLRPSVLDLGLVAAIEWQAREFEKQFGIRCEFNSNHPEIELHGDQATALFRIFQEALTNAAKHSRASWVKVSLISCKQSIELGITDNGKGITAEDQCKPHSFGILGMRERILDLGGALYVSGGKFGGTEVRLKIPRELR